MAVRLARQGADAALVAPMADDAAGRLLREALLAEHVSLRALHATRTAAVIALLDAVGERTMLSDRQTLDPSVVAPLLEGAGLDPLLRLRVARRSQRRRAGESCSAAEAGVCG